MPILLVLQLSVIFQHICSSKSYSLFQLTLVQSQQGDHTQPDPVIFQATSWGHMHHLVTGHLQSWHQLHVCSSAVSGCRRPDGSQWTQVHSKTINACWVLLGTLKSSPENSQKCAWSIKTELAFSQLIPANITFSRERQITWGNTANGITQDSRKCLSIHLGQTKTKKHYYCGFFISFQGNAWCKTILVLFSSKSRLNLFLPYLFKNWLQIYFIWVPVHASHWCSCCHVAPATRVLSWPPLLCVWCLCVVSATTWVSSGCSILPPHPIGRLIDH